jgi:N-acetylmuramoyl-L-alanine amidase
MMKLKSFARCLAFSPLLLAIGLAGCAAARPGAHVQRKGDEIVVAGQFFHTGTPVVLWLDPGGYDAYRVERRFSPLEKSNWESSRTEEKSLATPNRFGLRQGSLSDEEIERVRGGGWDLGTLRKVVDQFVLHYDGCGTSRQCFKVLHDLRGLSVHLLLDLDGTIYQTLDLKERAWHATSSNTRSVGIEIANIGAYSPEASMPFARWYEADAEGQTHIKIPVDLADGGQRTKDFIGRPARPTPITGVIQGKSVTQYDFTSQQYDALIKLTASLAKIFPRLSCDYPRDKSGQLINGKLPEADLNRYSGILGHFHVQADKIDPGPAFQWDRVIEGARRLNSGGMSDAANQTSRGHLRNSAKKKETK